MPGLVDGELTGADGGAGGDEGGAVNGAWEETELQDLRPKAKPQPGQRHRANSAGPSPAHKQPPTPPAAGDPPPTTTSAPAMPLSSSRDEFLHAEAIEYGRKGGCFVSTSRAVAFVFAAVLFAALVGVLVYYFGVATRKPVPVAQAATNGTGAAGAGGEAPAGGVSGGGTGGGAGGGAQEPAPASQRLSPHVRPHLYQLNLKPYLGDGANFSFIGHVAITISIEGTASVHTIVFHSKQLNISADEVAVTVDNTNSTAPAARNSSSSDAAGRPTVVSQRADPAQETYALTVSPPLHPGTHYVLEIPFRGVLRDSLTGFYRTSYQEDGRTKWMALTQFEATDARAAFPCFDEPGLKAKFQISIAHSTNYVAVSNMPIVRTEQIRGEPGWVVDHFGITPPMSTYLVAFIVSEMVFEAVNDSVPVMTTPEQRPPPPVTDTAAPAVTPAGTASSSATPKGKSLTTGFSTETGSVDVGGINETTVTSITSSAANTSSRYMTVANGTTHELTDVTTAARSSEASSGSVSAGNSSMTSFSDTLPASTKAGTAGTTVSVPAKSSVSGNLSVTEMAVTGSNASSSILTSSGSTAAPSGTPTLNGNTAVSTNSTGNATVSHTGSAETTPPGVETSSTLQNVSTAPSSSGPTPPAPQNASAAMSSTGPTSTTPQNVSTATSSSGPTSSAPQNTSAATPSSGNTSTSPAAGSSAETTASGSSAAGGSPRTTFAVTDSETSGSSVSTANITGSAHGSSVTSAASGGVSHAPTMVAETTLRTHGITALPLTGRGTSAGYTNRYATAVFVPSNSQVAVSRSGAAFPRTPGITVGLTGPPANGLLSTPEGRRKREAPAAGDATNGTASPLQIRMIVRPHLREQAHYALSVTPKILNFYADYFGIGYPLPKLDFAAIPDFQYGGMENWGLITYWETQVLIGPDTTTDGLEKAATTVVHELGHQWFGNLVTPTWWTDIWLNEGFATYLEYLATDFIEPTWEMIDKFVNDLHDVMSVDSMQSTHPVSNAVGSAAQILQAFDDISYTKGACLIRMLNHSLTEPVFRKGLLIYIDKWKYSNAKQDDLWWSLEEAANTMSLHEHALPQNATVKEVMDSWTLQPGFPVVTAIRDYVNGSVTINQTRFTTDGRPAANSSSQAWYIPVSFATQDEVRSGNASTKARVWLGVEGDRRSTTVLDVLPSGAPGAAKWLLLNLQHTGYYRVNYDRANWELLVRQLATAPLQLPVATRAQLVSDSLALARAGALPYAVALNLTRYLRDSRAELSLVPWQAFLDGTLHLEAGLCLTPTYVPLKKYMLSVLMPLLGRLQFDPQSTDSLATRQLRARALSRALRLEARNVTDWAARLFARWMAAPANYSVPVDLRPTVYCAAVMRGGEAEFNFAMSQFRNTTDPAQQRVLLSGLMCSRQPSLIAMLLHAPLEGKIMRVQDALTVWRAVPRNPVARPIAFDYIREHWTNLTKRFSDTDFPIKDMLEGATAGLSTQVQLDDLKAFRESHEGQFAYTSAAIERAVESLQEVVSWTRRFHNDIAEWLDSPAAAVPRDVYRATTSAARPSTPAVSPASSSPAA